MNGDRNTVRGGVMRDLTLGVWFRHGFGNQYGSIHFVNVGVHERRLLLTPHR